jgi:hypothetical protein
MFNIGVILLFFFIFSILVILRTIFNFIRTLQQDTPQPFVLSSRGLIYLGIALSYTITYLIKL